MIDLAKSNILTDNLVPLKNTSYYMTSSVYEVVDFDKVKDTYIFKGSSISSDKMRSNDALVVLPAGNDFKFIFIEFKNGKLDTFCEELKHEKIRSKINESLWILNDILNESLPFDRQNINYILVYNKVKNSKYAMASYLAKKAGKTFLIAGFSRYNVFFHNVKTMSDTEFVSISEALENGTYNF